MTNDEPTIIVTMKRGKGAVKAVPALQRVQLISQRMFVYDIVELRKATVFDRSTLEAAMYVLASSLVYQLRNACSVKWDGLGIFSPTFRDGRLNFSFTPSKDALLELRKAKVKVVNTLHLEDEVHDIVPIDSEDF